MSHHFNRIILKNISGMNDPAFKSNNTLKKYINTKLISYQDSSLTSCPKTRDIIKFKERVNSKILHYRNNKINKDKYFSENSFNSKTQTNNLSRYNNNISLNNLGKNKNKKNEKINIKKVSKPKEKKLQNYTEIILTPNNNKNKSNIKTPMNNLNKIKSIYKRKNILLNKSYKSPHSNTIFKKDKESNESNKKLYMIKSPENKIKNSLIDIEFLTKEIYNIINKKSLNNTYNHNIENLKKVNNAQDSTNNDININKKDLLLIDESFNERECPEPMPYVKKYSNYSDFIDKENISNSTINIINNFNKDLNEPKEEKNVPLPISKININRINNTYNRKFVYLNPNKYSRK